MKGGCPSTSHIVLKVLPSPAFSQVLYKGPEDDEWRKKKEKLLSTLLFVRNPGQGDGRSGMKAITIPG
jgi:hypothetical protein